MSTTAINVGYHPLDMDYCCIQQPSNIYNHQQEEDQEKKDKLIQAATQRLRQKLLEHKYQMLMSDIVEMQSKLDIIKLEASISLQSMDTQHLDHFEKRLENHKLQLQSIVITSSNPKREIVVESNNTISSSLSSFSSTISSVFSFRDNQEREQEDYFAILGHGKQKRRKRQKIIQGEYDEDDNHSSSAMSGSASTSNNVISSNISSSSSSSSSDYESDTMSPISNYKNMNNMAPDVGRKGLLVLHSISQENGLIKERNALDDTLSFLNDLASDSDDGGFRQDIIQLLDTIHYNNHKDSSCKSVPIPTCFCYNHTSPTSNNNNTTMWNWHGFIESLLHNILSTSWKWIRFAIIMTLAILINLRKGPTLF